MANTLTLKSVKARARDVVYLRSTLHPGAAMSEYLAARDLIIARYGDKGRDAWGAMDDARRFVNLADNWCVVGGEGARKAELTIQDWLGNGMYYRVHLVANNTLCNVTAGAAALVGVSTREMSGRWWLKWDNGRDDLAYRLGEMVGVPFYVHVI